MKHQRGDQMNAPANTIIAKEFFSLNGRYCIDPSSKPTDLASDASCLLDGVIQTVQAVIDGMSNKGSQMSADAHKQVPAMLFGVLFQLEMVKNLTDALEILN
ncbi:hypothetical protein [Dyella acidiphila]|uniref:DUF3077 domain-containing protein n=1 Tax=Dyella acidiphila TaxID=2775866 RepID=A0ABR9G6G8_9GAMM|nr:hypothetical protein [Dyella acidiphila]MBE1159638.1 hypothetical protein [Dyella acidiphila]